MIGSPGYAGIDAVIEEMNRGTDEGEQRKARRQDQQ